MERLNISVLLVEDDKISRVLYSNFLKKIVSKVFLAEDGIEGIELFRSHQPDLIISDIKMPRMDGLEMIHEIRKTDDSIKVLFVSGHKDTDYFIKSIELGVSGYLLKPIDQNKLNKIIQDIGKTLILDKKVKETEKRFRDLAELLPEIVFETDLTGKLTFVNKRALEILGYTTADIEDGLILHKVILPELDSIEKIDGILNNAQKNDLEKELEIRVRTKTGKTFPALMYISFILEGKEAVGIRGVMVNISKQKQNENELRRNQQTIERILQSSPDPIVVTNLNYEIIKYNQAAKTLFSRTFDGDSFGKVLLDMIVLDQREKAYKDYKTLEHHDFIKNIEFSFLDIDKKEIFTEVSASVIRDKDGNPDLIVSIIKDITERKQMIRELQLLNMDLESKVKERTQLLTNEIEERKQAEQALIESQERHSALSKAAFEAIIISEDQVCLETNQAAVDLFEYSYNELTGKNLFNLFANESHDALEASFLENNEDIIEVIANKKSKSNFPAEIQSKKYKYKDKDVRVTAIRDISLRKYAEKLLRQRIRFIELINKTSSEFIRLENVEIDEGIENTLKEVARFTNASRGYVYQLNIEEKKFTLSHEWSFKNINSRSEKIKDIPMIWFEGIYERLDKGELVTMDDKTIKKLGLGVDFKNALDALDFQSSIHLPMFIGRLLIGFYGFDTVKKNHQWSEEALNAYEITGQIIANAIQRKRYDEELIKAKDKAEESDKSKSVFLANVSHEIQTPIKAIISFANMLQTPDLSMKRRAEFLHIINSNSQALLNLTNDILEFTRIRSNMLKLFQINFELNLFLQELYTVFNSLKVKRGKENIKLNLKIPNKNKTCMISSDPSRLKQVLSNLIENAFKFTNKGHVEYGYENGNNGTIRFFVNDTGLGISKKYQKLIFDRFIQEPKPLNIKKEGTGLGLAITHSLISLMDGKIWVESELGKGSTFYFEIPNIIVPVDKKKEILSWDNKQVLIVEEVIQDYIQLEEILKERIKILFVGTGKQALEICRNNRRINLVLVAYSLLVKSKMELIPKLKKINPELTIIGMKQKMTPSEVDSELIEQMDDTIEKPLVQEEILPVLDKYLRSKI